MKHHSTRGSTLIETLAASAIFALVALGAGSHFRSAQQVNGFVVGRGESYQKARVALERIARHVRCARRVDRIGNTPEGDHELAVSDASGTQYVFLKNHETADLEYGIDLPTDVLAASVDATFQGYSAAGPVPDGEPERITSVQVTIAALAAAETGAAVTATTRVYLRTLPQPNKVRCTTSYATQYETSNRGGVANYDLAFGAPDDAFASPTKDGDGDFFGFDRGAYTGTVHVIHAGLRIRYHSGWVNVEIYHGEDKFYDVEYGDNDLENYLDRWGWLWIPITDLRASWTDADIPELRIEVEDAENLDIDYDSFAIRALFDPPLVEFFPADREGAGVESENEWSDVARTFGMPDNSYTLEYWEGEPDQSFRVSVPAASNEVITAYAAVVGYVASNFDDGKIQIWAALPTEGNGDTIRYEIKKEALRNYADEANKGTILQDVSNSRDWSWSDLGNVEIRLKLKKERHPTSIMVDAVGWSVQYVIPTAMEIGTWSEP